MTKTVDGEAYRRTLLRLARRLREGVEGLGGESGGGLSAPPAHPADLGGAGGAERMGLALLAKEERLLEECDAALARIEAGTFGRCEDCSRAIARKRLRALPFARQCIRCARLAGGAL
jgi:RNA polymerase-binding transcription factor DksA